MVLSRSDTELASRIDFWHIADHLDLGLLVPMNYTKGIWETWLRLVHYFSEGWDLRLPASYLQFFGLLLQST